MGSKVKKPEFNVGDRVRVRIAKDVIKEVDIECDVGIVINVKLYFPATPLARLEYTVRLDRPYCSFIGTRVKVSTGHNIDETKNTIEREQ